MKKFILSVFALSMMALSSNADICIPGDLDFDAADCAANGGSVGTPSGIGGGPGGGGPTSNGVPIDGGLSVMLVVGGALSARRAFKKKKEEQA